MRFIRKQGSGGYHLEQANQHPPASGDDATRCWGRFDYKQDVQQQLLYEQYQLCCYSELRADLEGLGYHIEHVENKRQNPARTFDYQNLAASALDSRSGLAVIKATGSQAFGGHAAGKQAAVDMQRFVSCHQADCHRFFSYVSDGRVVPAHGLSTAEQARAQYTIDLLNLNSSYLIVRRQQHWRELEALFEQHIEEDMDLQCLAAVYLLPRNHELESFFSLSRGFLGHIAEDVLRLQAPELS